MFTTHAPKPISVDGPTPEETLLLVRNVDDDAPEEPKIRKPGKYRHPDIVKKLKNYRERLEVILGSHKEFHLKELTPDIMWQARRMARFIVLCDDANKDERGIAEGFLNKYPQVIQKKKRKSVYDVQFFNRHLWEK